MLSELPLCVSVKHALPGNYWFFALYSTLKKCTFQDNLLEGTDIYQIERKTELCNCSARKWKAPVLLMPCVIIQMKGPLLTELQQKVEETEMLKMELQMLETERVRLSLVEEKLMDVLQLLQQLRDLVWQNSDLGLFLTVSFPNPKWCLYIHSVQSPLHQETFLRVFALGTAQQLQKTFKSPWITLRKKPRDLLGSRSWRSRYLPNKKLDETRKTEVLVIRKILEDYFSFLKILFAVKLYSNCKLILYQFTKV